MPYRIVQVTSQPAAKPEYSDDDLEGAIAQLKMVESLSPGQKFQIVKVTEDNEKREMVPIKVEDVYLTEEQIQSVDGK